MNDQLLMEVSRLGAVDLLALLVLSLPPLFVLLSRRTRGRRKLWWVLLTSLFSWLAYVPYLLMTRKADDSRTPPDDHA